MTAQHEVAIRTAVEELVVAILAAVQAERLEGPAARDRLLSIAEAATVLGVGRTAVYQELTAGRLRSFKVGRRRLISTSVINAYIEAGAMVTVREFEERHR